MCDVSRCKRPVMLTYAALTDKRMKDVEVCKHHWDKHCDDGDKFDLRVHFKRKKK